MDIIKTLFWFSAAVVVYAYIGYPVVMWLLSSLMPSRSKEDGKPFLPKVSLLISAYNEEAVIEGKILNSLSAHYPADLLEIMIISDGSDDMTNEIVRKYEKRGVLLKYFQGRRGKTACLNSAVTLAQGDIIVFSDANSMYDEDAIKNLVSNFADDRIGFVTGYTRYVEKDADQVAPSIGIYAKIEKLTKAWESKLSSCVGADGAIFAIRRHLYRPLSDVDINDFVIPLNIIKQGLKGVLEEKAYCVEKTAGNSKGEFRRQTRITNRTLRAIYNNASLLNPLRYGFFSFELFSHKISKFLTPFFLLSLACCSVVLMNSGTTYRLISMVQAVCYLFALLGYSGKGLKILSGLDSLCYTFVAMNAAILAGWVQFVRGRTYTTWSPVKR
jgi:cellulose synthase/poly-beta-1,6-N-acetylglucosamine synthase-like glycosyltransferase